MGISCDQPLRRQANGREAQAPSSRICIAEGGERGGTASGRYQAREPPRISPFFCHALARGWLRYPNRPGVIRPQDVSTTMIYTHVLNRGGKGVFSPADRL